MTLDYTKGIDCASRPYGQAVANAGYGYIFRYLSSGGSSIPGKQLLADEAASYLDNNVRLVSNWETDATMMLGGYSQGKDDSHAATEYHNSIGGPDSACIYYSADFDATPDQQIPINAYLQACIDNYGITRVGVYGSFYVCMRAQAAFPGIRTWVTDAWSGGQVGNVNVHQNNDWGYVYVGGAQCDPNTILTPGNVGAWNGEDDNMDQSQIQAAVLSTPIHSAVDGNVYPLAYILGAIDFNTNMIGEARLKSLVDNKTQMSIGGLLQSIDLHTFSETSLSQQLSDISTKLQTLNDLIGRLQ